MFLSTVVKPWRLHFKDGRNDIAITEEEARTITSWLQDKTSRFYEFCEEDGTEYVFAKNDIKGLTKKTASINSGPTKGQYTCDWGNTHPSHIDRCDCWGTYKMSGLKMWRYIKEKWDIHYNHQITEEMRRYALERHKNNNQI